MVLVKEFTLFLPNNNYETTHYNTAGLLQFLQFTIRPNNRYIPFSIVVSCTRTEKKTLTNQQLKCTCGKMDTQQRVLGRRFGPVRVTATIVTPRAFLRPRADRVSPVCPIAGKPHRQTTHSTRHPDKTSGKKYSSVNFYRKHAVQRKRENAGLAKNQ